MSQVVDITALLQAAQSPDAAARQQAEAGLKQLREAQPATYLLSLSSHLSSENNPVDTRRLAGGSRRPIAMILILVGLVSAGRPCGSPGSRTIDPLQVVF